MSTNVNSTTISKIHYDRQKVPSSSDNAKFLKDVKFYKELDKKIANGELALTVERALKSGNGSVNENPSEIRRLKAKVNAHASKFCTYQAKVGTLWVFLLGASIATGHYWWLLINIWVLFMKTPEGFRNPNLLDMYED